MDETGAARVALPGVYIRVDVGRLRKEPRANLGWTPFDACGLRSVDRRYRRDGRGAHGSDWPSAFDRGRLAAIPPEGAPSGVRGGQGSQLAPHCRRRREVARHLRRGCRAAANARVDQGWSAVAEPCAWVTDLGARLSAKGVAWNTTGALAADVLAPYLTEVDPWRSTSTVAPWPNYGRSRVRPEWSRPMVVAPVAGIPDARKGQALHRGGWTTCRRVAAGVLRPPDARCPGRRGC